MSQIVYHQPNGSQQTVQLTEPDGLMQAALKNNVPGIVGECGGQAMCATCHVYVREEYLDQLPLISEEEEEMLEVTADERDYQRSRLGCQITAGPGMGHIEVNVPEVQV